MEDSKMQIKEYLFYLKSNQEEQNRLSVILFFIGLIPVFIYIYFKMSAYQLITPNMEYYLSEINRSLYQSGLLKNMRI
jgi:hypothetical protein